MEEISWRFVFSLLLLVLVSQIATPTLGIRFPQAIPEASRQNTNRPLRAAVFALGSFWRSEAAFGCLPGVVRTLVGYAGGTKPNPEYRNLGNHAECVQIEYDPTVISFKQLLDVFWASHDPRQVFGQGPDVGNQYRSIIFTNGSVEARLAASSKETEQTKSRSSIVTTQIQQLGVFYPAESDHQPELLLAERNNVLPAFVLIVNAALLQKFELKRNKFLLQLIGNIEEEELQKSTLAAKLNSYAAELCPPKIQKQIDAKIDEILKIGWPILREL
ncbi:Peptide methionine sulfoxide reductase A5 [Dendrobium catenatum]|uniref:Peptide methionine sulfoxide reductase A5 n=1 Tax=Dendrobium catenatum TaxID=906689 RepID=A0A2I0WIM1_9ASPA|nr:Peptide methionine sulfoxide reductase A5 [Dendrobium catenatum]